MANGLYIEGRNGFLKGSIAWATDTIGAVLIDETDYTVSLTTHRYLGDIPSAAREEATTLTNTNVVNGACDADDAVFSGTSGDACDAIVIYKDTGSAATSPLIAYIDTVSSGLPVTLGGTVTVEWDNLDSRIFKISDAITAECVTLTFTSDTKTGAYTAGLNEHVLYDASGGTLTIDAPASPSRDDTFGIKNDHDTDATSITVDGNGANLEGPAGGASAATVAVASANASYVWKYDGTEWLLV